MQYIAEPLIENEHLHRVECASLCLCTSWTTSEKHYHVHGSHSSCDLACPSSLFTSNCAPQYGRVSPRLPADTDYSLTYVHTRTRTHSHTHHIVSAALTRVTVLLER